MKTAYKSTRQAALAIGLSFRQINKWLADGTIKVEGVPIPSGGRLWLWTDADIKRGRKIKATMKAGRKPGKGNK
jgi:hypothetical protein